MKILCLTGILLFISLATQATPLSLPELLKIKSGQKLEKIELTGETKDYSYEIVSEKGNLKSLLIEFNQPQPSEKFFKANEHGYCLLQKSSPDVHHNNLFFFKKETYQRFESNNKLQIKSILVASFPEADTNLPCQFADLKKLDASSRKLIKVKANK